MLAVHTGSKDLAGQIPHVPWQVLIVAEVSVEY